MGTHAPVLKLKSDGDEKQRRERAKQAEQLPPIADALAILPV